MHSRKSAKGPPAIPRRVAIVGGGIAGIACSWRLRKYHDIIVDIFDLDSRLGGHANSVPFHGSNGQSVDVDTGFIAMDEATYPQFNAFLHQLGIQTVPTDMSFGVSTAGGGFEWGSYSLLSFLGNLWSLLQPWIWRLGFDIIRFRLFARDILYEVEADHDKPCEETPLLNKSTADGLASVAAEAARYESIGTCLKRWRYSDQFIRYFLIPMAAAPWCNDPDEFAQTFPAKPLIQFMFDHRIIDTVTKTMRWRSFRNGSKTYVDAFQKSLPSHHHVYLSTPVRRVHRLSTGDVSLEFTDGRPTQTYDHVVLAVHANQALSLLGDGASSLEQAVLGSFHTSKNVCVLHSDTSLLPKRPSAQVAWNCFLDEAPPGAIKPQGVLDGSGKHYQTPSSKISITFDMNKLQAIPFPDVDPSNSPGRVLVTMNPIREPRGLVQDRHTYYHPVITAKSIAMARRIHLLHDGDGESGGVSFAGAWMGFGFHEDGFAAGVHAATALVQEPVGRLDLISRVGDFATRSGSRPKIGWLEGLLRLVVIVVQWLLAVIG